MFWDLQIRLWHPRISFLKSFKVKVAFFCVAQFQDRKGLWNQNCFGHHWRKGYRIQRFFFYFFQSKYKCLKYSRISGTNFFYLWMKEEILLEETSMHTHQRESSRERKVQVLESLRELIVWRSTETRARRGSRPESLRWVCEWLWGPRGGGDIPTTCISAIFHLSLLFVVKEASQLWKAKSSVGSSL